ncbi:unnamed protein product [Rotaria sp. Silwood2]|nr:unnamed protein product [Rotaria sp. Silwood2]
MVQGALDDDCYQKFYPGIVSELLLENLIKLVQDTNNRPTKDGAHHGTLYTKPNGQQIDSSHRYYLMKEPNLTEFNLYVRIRKERNVGKVSYLLFYLFGVHYELGKLEQVSYYRIYTNKAEVKILVGYGLNYLKQPATLPIVADYLQFTKDSKYLIARERCEFISRLLNNNVAATRNSSKINYDVTKLGTRQQQPQKRPKAHVATATVSTYTSTPTSQPRTQKQV